MKIPFDFTFFGQTFNEFVISGNGFISFNTELANTFCTWQFSNTIPNADFPVKNVILGCYHDMNSVATGSQASRTSTVLGEAPYRQFVIAFNDMPQYYCSQFGSSSSFQIILHETLNYIDIQITKKDLCLDWNNGNTVLGIIDATGTIAYSPEGRNTGAWEVTTGEGWRFKTDATASIPDNLMKNPISLYPNPSSGILNIENNSGKVLKDISFYSVTGALVKQTIDNKINISNLQNGIYIVKIQMENQILNYKLIKN